MNVLITVVVVVIVLLVAALVFVRVTRQPGAESPKRRELTRARVRAATAERAMHDIDGIITRYRPVLDDVESALATELTDRIRLYKEKILEIEQ